MPHACSMHATCTPQAATCMLHAICIHTTCTLPVDCKLIVEHDDIKILNAVQINKQIKLHDVIIIKAALCAVCTYADITYYKDFWVHV